MELNAGAIGRDTVKRSMRPNCGEWMSSKVSNKLDNAMR
jgi:hypothetical protein